MGILVFNAAWRWTLLADENAKIHLTVGLDEDARQRAGGEVCMLIVKSMASELDLRHLLSQGLWAGKFRIKPPSGFAGKFPMVASI